MICPMINTEADARRLVEAARTLRLADARSGRPGHLVHGQPMPGPRTKGHASGDDRTREALSNLTILAVDGIDGVYVGPPI